MYLKKNPKVLWLVFYILINFTYLIFIHYRNQLFGENGNVPINPDTPVFLIGNLVIFSYLFFNGFLFSVLKKIKQKEISRKFQNKFVVHKIGTILLILQILFIFYFLYTDTYVAGSSVRDNSILSFFWVLIPVDVLFYIYYGIYRDQKLFLPNLMVWILSSLLRGWSGIFLTILFFESCRQFRSGTLNFKKIFKWTVLLIFAYPPLYLIKLYIRSFGSMGLSSLASSFDINNILNFLNSLSFFDLMLASINQIFDRLQIVSSAIAVYEYSADLYSDLAHGLIYPLWMEGIHGVAIDRISGYPALQNLGVAFAKYLDPLSSDVNWNSNPTFVGWLLIDPEMSLAYLLWAVFLCLVSVVLTRRLSTKELAFDMVWYAWLVYLIPGWFGAFFLFVYSLLLLYGLHLVIGFISKQRGAPL